MKLRSTLTAVVTAATLAFTSAVPAKADPDTQDLITFLAGIAALSIIANSANGRTDYVPEPAPDWHPQPRYYPQPQPVYPRPQPVYPRPQPQHIGLPGNCAIKFQTRNGWERGYTYDCLSRNGLGRGLPQHCLRELRTTSGWSRIYGDYCLRQAGY